MFQVKIYLKFGIFLLLLIGLVIGRNRTGRQLSPYLDHEIESMGYQYLPVMGGNLGSSRQSPMSGPPLQSSGYKPGPPPHSDPSGGYKPGPPPSSGSSGGYQSDSLTFPSGPSGGYQPGPPPPHLPSSNAYRPGPPMSAGFSEGYFNTNSVPFAEVPPDYLGYHGSSSPYGGGHMMYYTYPSGGGNSVGSSSGYMPGKPPQNFSTHGVPMSSGSAAAAAASAGFGSASASASSSSSSHIHYGWRPPAPYPPLLPPPQQPSSSPPPEPMFGWGPSPQPIPPTRPVPEFNYQFSLKPSAFGWETSYNVPCGNYKIQPRVIAHLRLATQAVLPKPPAKSKGPPLPENDYEEDERRERSSSPNHNAILAASFLDPVQLERSLHYSPYHQQQFSIPRPTFRPRTCRWNFNAAGGCKLNFKCSWFQLPALFRCEENFLHVTDHTILLNSRFCGNRRPRRIISSSTGKLSLTFKSEGAALPAIFDCTVICAPEASLGSDLKTPPAPTEQPSNAPSSLPPLRYNSPSASPVVLHKPHGIASDNAAASTNKRNSTLISSFSSKPQLRMGNCKCGVPDSHYLSKIIHGRIVGGSSMIPGESPWTAALVKRNSNRPYCGAALLNDRFLISAAHCVLNQTRKARENPGNIGSGSENKTGTDEKFYFDVLLNEHDITQANEIAGGTIRAKVNRVIIHPNYDNVTFDFDAALIRLAKPLEFNPWEGAHQTRSAARINKNVHYPFYYNPFGFHSFKRKRRFILPEIEARAIPPKPVPICLPDRGRGERKTKNYEGQVTDDYAVVTGWGLVHERGIPSNEMLKARVQMFNDTTCQELYKKHNYVITNSMMCAGYINGNIDSCVGDSGSPLAIQDKDRSVLTGVVSWGRGCGRKQLPGVYTKVTESERIVTFYVDKTNGLDICRDGGLYMVLVENGTQ